MRLIDADALLLNPIAVTNSKGQVTWSAVSTMDILAAPTVDAVEVVRCRDCKHWLPEEPERCKALKQEPYGLCNIYPQRTDWYDTTYHDDFCSYGKRRDNEV